MSFLFGLILGFILFFAIVGLVAMLGKVFGIWQILQERTVVVYTLFGKVIGTVKDPGVFFPIVAFGPRALLLPFAGKAYRVSTALEQSYLRNQLVNSEEGAPMGVGIWYEMQVADAEAFLFKNADPAGSLGANVATAVTRQLSNLKLEVLLENRDALSKRVREEVSPTSSQWGYRVGSTYVRKVAFRDAGMILEIERKVVNRLRQVTAAMKQEGSNRVAIIQSAADKQASERLGQAQAVRPKVIGAALAEIRTNMEVADALFRLLDIQATIKSAGKTIITPSQSVDLLLSS